MLTNGWPSSFLELTGLGQRLAVPSRIGRSAGALGVAVNRVAAEAGVELHHDRTTVAHWLAGARPRPEVRGFVLEALSRQIGRALAVQDAGWTDRSEHGAAYGHLTAGLEDIVVPFEQLAASGRDRRAVLRTTLYSLAAARMPDFANLPQPTFAAAERVERVGTAQVRSATLMLEVFSDMDTAFGGGRVRPAIAAYLGTDITHWPHAPAGPAARNRVIVVAADLSYLAGFTSFDDELHGTAQRYYAISARLAGAAGDPTRYAIALRAMSVQAAALQHRHEARTLADTAVDSAPSQSTQSAFLQGQLALACAVDGDRRHALHAMAEAERLLERAHSRTHASGIGAYHQASLAHQQAETMAQLGDLPAGIGLLGHSLRHRPAAERRSRAITRARLAELRLRIGHLDHACADWHAFLDDLPHLQTARTASAERTMRRQLLPHAKTSPAGELLDRATSLRQQAATGVSAR